MCMAVVVDLPIVLLPFGSTSMFSSTHLSSVGGAVDQHLYQAAELTATSRHTVDDNILLLGDEFLDHIYLTSIYICGGERCYSIQHVEKSFVPPLMISSIINFRVATYQEDRSLADPADHYPRSIISV